jgi:hypothetical protein
MWVADHPHPGAIGADLGYGYPQLELEVARSLPNSLRVVAPSLEVASHPQNSLLFFFFFFFQFLLRILGLKTKGKDFLGKMLFCSSHFSNE